MNCQGCIVVIVGSWALLFFFGMCSNEAQEEHEIPSSFKDDYLFENNINKKMTISKGSVIFDSDKTHILSVVDDDSFVKEVSYNLIKVRLNDNTGGYCEGTLDTSSDYLIANLTGTSSVCSSITGRWVEKDSYEYQQKNKKEKVQKSRKNNKAKKKSPSRKDSKSKPKEESKNLR